MLGDFRFHGDAFPGKMSASPTLLGGISPFNVLRTEQSLTEEDGIASVSLHGHPKARRSFHLRAQAGQLMGEVRMSWDLLPESSASCLHPAEADLTCFHDEP